MALFDTHWHIDSVNYAALTAWATGTAKVVGDIIRQNTAPSVGNERAFICVVAGTTHATTEPTWTVTRGAKTTDNTVTWQECTGQPAVNGNARDTPLSSSVRSQNISLGVIVKNNSGTHYFICTTSGNAGAGEPTYNTSTGATTVDNACTWTCIGAVGDFNSWEAPHARLGNAWASTWGGSADTFWVASSHAETQASAISITNPASYANPTYTYCVNKNNAEPTSANLTTGASVTCTGNNSMTLSVTNGVWYVSGITFSCGSGAVGPILGITGAFLTDCALRLPGTNPGTIRPNTCELRNTTVEFGAVGSSLFPAGKFVWKDTPNAIQGATIPNNLITTPNTPGIVENVDLSAAGVGKNIIGFTGNGGDYLFSRCKLHASVTRAVASTALPGSRAHFINCHSGDVQYGEFFVTGAGTQDDETTIVRTGGASDGVTTKARKYVSVANCKFAYPLEGIPIYVWNEDVGASKTVTMYGIWGGVAVPNNEDIWFDVDYFGTSGSALGAKATCAKASPLHTASNHASDSSMWGGSTTAFKMEITFTPQEKGWIVCTPKVGRASATFYIDPKVDVT